MGNGNVVAGSSRLKHAIKQLQDQWQTTEAAWSDSVRRRFEDRYLAPLDSAIDSALIGIQKIGEVLEKVRRDCSDRSEML